MVSTYSPLKIQLMATGENDTTWGDITNVNLGTALEEAIANTANITFASADVTLTLVNLNTSQSARRARLSLIGTTGGVARNLIVPAIEKAYIVSNSCADAVTIKNATGTGITVPPGMTLWVYNNATNVVSAVNYLTDLTLGTALSVANGGTGSTAWTANALLLGNGTSTFLTVSPGTAGNILTSNGTTWTSAPAPASGVTSFSGGTTGLTPASATSGAVTLSGTLNVANGGTGLTTPGASGNLLASNGTGFTSITTVPVANGGTGQTTIAAVRVAVGTGAASRKTANYTAVAGDVLACDTIAVGVFTVTLPASPAAGDLPITIFDAGTTNVANGFATNNLTIARNGNTIHTLAEDVTVSTKGVTIVLEYINGTWRMRNG